MILLDEELKPISPQEAKDKELFGPVYHGATSDKLKNIDIQGFKIPIGHERSGEVSHGYELGAYGYLSIPAPIHHLGFGVYFTTVKSIAKQYSYGNPKIGPYFLDIPRLITINWGSPNTMMKWWIENGYDYKKTPETTFGSGKTDLFAIREERMRATLNLTETLKSKYDGVWYKGKGLYRLLDGDQVVVFDPSRIYKLDKSLVKPGEIGSKVISKVGIDPYNRGTITVPIGTKGIIIDKKKPTEYQKWAEGSEWLYAIKFETGGVVYDVVDQWIEPYVRKTRKELKEHIIYRRSFWKDYENLHKISIDEIVGHFPMTKREEHESIEYLKAQWKNKILKNTLKKSMVVPHINCGGGCYTSGVGYKGYDSVSKKQLLILLRKTPEGIYYQISEQEHPYEIWKKWTKIPISIEPINENKHVFNSDDFNMHIHKKHEDQIVNFLYRVLPPIFGDTVKKTLKKSNIKRKVKSCITGLTEDKIEYIFTDKFGFEKIVQISHRFPWQYQYRIIDPSKPVDDERCIEKDWEFIPNIRISEFYMGKINESLGKKYSPMTKKEEQETLQTIITRMRKEGREGKNFRKVREENDRLTFADNSSIPLRTDFRFYKYTAFDGTEMILVIRKRVDGIYYALKDESFDRHLTFYPINRKQSESLEENNPKRDNVYIKDNWKEGDEEHAQALHQTGYWGRQGAGAIILAQDTGRILLPFRSRYVEQPHTWGVWGGAIDENEDPATAVKREIHEEVGYAGPIQLIPMYVFEDPRVGFRYSNFLAIVPSEFQAHKQWETERSEWFEFGNWPKPLHFGLQALLQNSGNEILQNVKKFKNK